MIAQCWKQRRSLSWVEVVFLSGLEWYRFSAEVTFGVWDSELPDPKLEVCFNCHCRSYRVSLTTCICNIASSIEWPEWMAWHVEHTVLDSFSVSTTLYSMFFSFSLIPDSLVAQTACVTISRGPECAVEWWHVADHHKQCDRTDHEFRYFWISLCSQNMESYVHLPLIPCSSTYLLIPSHSALPVLTKYLIWETSETCLFLANSPLTCSIWALLLSSSCIR